MKIKEIGWRLVNSMGGAVKRMKKRHGLCKLTKYTFLA